MNGTDIHSSNTQPARMHNFNAGPSILPPSVFREAAEAVINYRDTGLSILEIGHRTRLFGEIMDEAITLVKELMQLLPGQEVLFLHGGASTQFFQVPMNLLDSSAVAGYADTGIWAAKAIQEARIFGQVDTVCSSREDSYRVLPGHLEINSEYAYLHLTTNNTIYGTQWHDLGLFYNQQFPLVADMSSDILSRVIDFHRFSLIYAGAQKNLGAAGVNLVVVNRDILGRVSRQIPTMLDYRKHIEAGSLLNTPPVFAIYTCLLNLRWLKSNGGVAGAEQRNREKAALLYGALDRLEPFRGTVAPADRSLMNACFEIPDPEAEKEFSALCEKEGMAGVKGHRTVGGFRVSLYNALPLSSVVALTQLMEFFAESKY